MVTKKNNILTVLLVLFLFKVSGLTGQITEDSAKLADQAYSKFYSSEMLTVSPDHKFGIVTDRNEYDIDRAFIVNLQSKKTQPIEAAFSYRFFGGDIMVAQLQGKTIIRHLKNGLYREIKGNFIYIPFQKVGKFILYDKQQRKAWLYNVDLQVVSSFKEIEQLSMFKDQPVIVFATKNKIFKMDFRSLQTSDWEISEKVLWLQSSKKEIVSISNLRGAFFLNRYSVKGSRQSEKIVLPEDFYIDSLSLSTAEIKNDRYLLLPVRKKERQRTKTRGQILYTNQNSIYRIPMMQVAIYDLDRQIWKRSPQSEDVFSQQFFADDKGTVISYDPSVDKVDSLGNPRYQLTIERDFGGKRVRIDNPYIRRINFHYDTPTGRMIYFKDRRWWIENTNDGKVDQIAFEAPSYFVSDYNSGLSDDPSGSVYPTNHYAKYLINDAYDFFLVDLVKLNVKRLTFGRESNVSYTISRDPSFFRGSTNWDMERNPEINLDHKILFKMFNNKNYNSGIAEFNLKTSKLSELFSIDDDVKNIFVADGSVVYTSKSYGKPLSVYSLKNKRSELIYSSKGIDNGNLGYLKKEMIQYEVGGKVHNAALLYPVNYSSQKKYPLIFDVYENKSKDALRFLIPDLYENQGFNAMHYVYSGYFVLLPDLAYEPEHIGRSISHSVEKLVGILNKNEAIDIKKMAVTGSSFGGYETTFLMTQDKWFVTGFAGVSLVDLPRYAMEFYRDFKLPNYFRVEKQQNRMVKNLFDNYQGYLDNSPIYHLKNMSKPILMWLGKDDGNVSPDQSRSFFLGLKRLGKKGILMEYDKEKHTLMKRENQFDVNVKGWQWMDHFLKDNRPADWITPLLE